MRLSIRAALAAEFQDAIAEATKKFTVVGDEKHRAFEVFQSFDQHLFRREVEVVCRLIKDQKVWRVKQHPGHDESCLLAARQSTDLLIDIVP